MRLLFNISMALRYRWAHMRHGFKRIFRKKARGGNAQNLVDERFELVALVFRLAGKQGHSEVRTAYQRRLNTRFSAFKEHPAVVYARESLEFAYDAVLNMAVHLEKTDMIFNIIENTGSLYKDGRWNSENAPEFVRLLNDFYRDTDFATFFAEQTDFYLEQSTDFKESVLDGFNFEWFRARGLNPDNLRVVLSPSGSSHNYGAFVCGANLYETIVYGAVCCGKVYGLSNANLLAHEFSHSYANDIAAAWYAENEQFRK